jgi:hypothetical protein
MSLYSRPTTRTRRYFKGIVVPRGMWDNASPAAKHNLLISIWVSVILGLYYQRKCWNTRVQIVDLQDTIGLQLEQIKLRDEDVTRLLEKH